MLGFLKRLFGGSPVKAKVRRILLGQATEPLDVMLSYAHGAGQAAIDTAKEENINLDFSDKSLFEVDCALDRLHASGVNEGNYPTHILAYGWYVGEVLVRTAGGRWRLASEVAAPNSPPGWEIRGNPGRASLVVELPNRTICDPIEKALRLVKSGSPFGRALREVENRFPSAKGEMEDFFAKWLSSVRASLDE